MKHANFPKASSKQISLRGGVSALRPEPSEPGGDHDQAWEEKKKEKKEKDEMKRGRDGKEEEEEGEERSR